MNSLPVAEVSSWSVCSVDDTLAVGTRWSVACREYCWTGELVRIRCGRTHDREPGRTRYSVLFRTIRRYRTAVAVLRDAV